MPLFLFLVEIMQRFSVVLTGQLDPWYFAAVERIGLLPRAQIAEILRAYGHAVLGPVCGLTVMQDDHQFHRTVEQIWIAEPDDVCRVKDLGFYLFHELYHALIWIRDGLAVWSGHN